MRLQTIRAIGLYVFCTAMSVLSIQCRALDLVRDGIAVATIVLPASPLPVERYAAQELQYHVSKATGQVLRIITEGTQAPPGAHLYIGRCNATQAAHVDAALLPGNSYILKASGLNFLIAGKDTAGEPLDQDTLVGTLFGVYDLLETYAGVRWLWPGKLGEVVPHRANLSLPTLNERHRPLLMFKEWRGGLSRPDWGEADSSHSGFVRDQAIWMRRQRFGRSVHPDYGHSFGQYWSRFSASHPEYFNMMPNGIRGPDPLGADMTPVGDWIHMCVSQPALWKQVIADWKVRGMPEFLNICENDGYAACACPQCLAWDEPDPDLSVPFGKRLVAATWAFNAKRDDWMLQLGSLSDRYAKFWKAIANEARKLRSNVKVVSYVYDNYRKPPIKPLHLGANVLCGFVPSVPVPYNKQASTQFRTEWSGWQRTGCMLFLRPNYTLYGHNYPLFYARDLGGDLKFAMAHGLVGTDFDSLTGQYSTQGPTLYVLAQILDNPDASVEGILDDYFSAFGAAQHTVKAYFDHWEKVSQKLSADEVIAIRKAKRKYGSELDLIMGPDIFTPEAMATGFRLLDEASRQTSGDSSASARVEWLTNGLKHAGLVLAAERAFEHAFDTGDASSFQIAYRAVNEFRSQHQQELLCDFGFLTDAENRVWNSLSGRRG